MRINPIMCAPGYLMSGGPVAFKHQPVIKAARVQWQRLGRTVDAVKVRRCHFGIPPCNRRKL